MKGYTGIVMYVAIDVKMMIARLGTTVKTKTVKLKPSDFTQQSQDRSIREVFEL
jgi:hypothetical protein